MIYQVYRNLHKGCWSIKEKGGKVVAHAEQAIMYHVTPVVNESGRQRVLREKRKNVHAYLEGQVAAYLGTPYQGRNVALCSVDDMEEFSERFLIGPISYNPYLLPYFFYDDMTYRPYQGSLFAKLTKGGVIA